MIYKIDGAWIHASQQIEVVAYQLGVGWRSCQTYMVWV
jgi:hypothetical protein